MANMVNYSTENIIVLYFSYQNSPDLRLTWLQHMAEKHTSVSVSEVGGCPVLPQFQGFPYVDSMHSGIF